MGQKKLSEKERTIKRKRWLELIVRQMKDKKGVKVVKDSGSLLLKEPLKQI